MLLSLFLPVYPALGDSGWDGFPDRKNPFEKNAETNSAFPKKGPLSGEAAERALDDRDSLSGQAGNGAGNVAGTSMDPCTISSCTPAQRAAEKAKASAQRIYGFANLRLRREVQARERIREAVEKSGLPKQEIRNFNRVFKDNTFPTDKKIETLAPPLRDAAYALRTSRAIENFLLDTARQNAKVAERTGAMEKKVAGNHRSNNSLSNQSLVRHEEKSARAGAERPKSGRLAEDGSSSGHFSGSTFLPGGSGGSPLLDIPTLGALPGSAGGWKEETGSNGQLGESDKSLVAGMLRDLQADLSKGQAGNTSLDPVGEKKAGLEDPGSIGGLEASMWMRNLSAVSSPPARTEALVLDPALQGELGKSTREISIFSRMHARIRACSERFGLEPR